MTSKNSNKKINILIPSTIKILILLSIIIILILIYLKLNNKELYTSVADIDNYFRKYFAKQTLYQEIQHKLDDGAKKINDLSDDIQTVLSGKRISPAIDSTSTESTFSLEAAYIETLSTLLASRPCTNTEGGPI